MLAFRALCLFICVALLPALAQAQYQPAGCLNSDEVELAQSINTYRAANALPAVPISTVLTEVGQWHVADSQYATFETGDYGQDPNCNLHTWYGIPAAPYTTCCYTNDHAQASCMWNKPTEVSLGSYTSSGFEIAASGYATVAAALAAWQASSGHNDVILNQGSWASFPWSSMGVAADTTNKFYYVWFATAPDPLGAPVACSSAPIPVLDGAARYAAIVALLLLGAAMQWSRSRVHPSAGRNRGRVILRESREFADFGGSGRMWRGSSD